MNAFEVSKWIDILGSGHDPKTLDEKSIDAVKRLFQLTGRLTPVGSDDRKEFWISAKRGTLEE